MKENDIILEKIHFKFPSPYDNSRDVIVIKNPNDAEFNHLLSKSLHRELRGITNSNVVYIWDANLATHNDVINMIDNTVDIGKFIISDSELLNSDEYKDDDYFANHKMIKRMLKSN